MICKSTSLVQLIMICGQRHITLIKLAQILRGENIDTRLKYLNDIDYNLYFIILCQDFVHSRYCLQSIIEMRRGKIIHINFIGVRLLN